MSEYRAVDADRRTVYTDASLEVVEHVARELGLTVQELDPDHVIEAWKLGESEPTLIPLRWRDVPASSAARPFVLSVVALPPFTVALAYLLRLVASATS